MEILFIITIVVIGYTIWTIKNGNLSFWKVAAKYPDEVFKLMAEDKDMWVIELGDIDAWQGKNKTEYTGPFRLYVPYLNSFVKIYGKAEMLEVEQTKILNQVTPTTK